MILAYLGPFYLDSGLATQASRLREAPAGDADDAAPIFA